MLVLQTGTSSPRTTCISSISLCSGHQRFSVRLREVSRGNPGLQQQQWAEASAATPHLFPKGMSDTMMSTQPVRRGRLQMSHWMMSKGMPGAELLQVQNLHLRHGLLRFELRRSLGLAKQQGSTNKGLKCISAHWTSSLTTLQGTQIPPTPLTFPYSPVCLAKSRCCLLLSSQPVGCCHQQCGSSSATP